MCQFPLEYVEMEPGDVLFFHCNLLHSGIVNICLMMKEANFAALCIFFLRVHQRFEID